MRYLQTSLQILLFFVFYGLGEWIHQLFHLRIPGSMIGFMLLFLCLLCKVVRIEWVDRGSRFMQLILPLLFVPAMVGAVDHYQLFFGWPALLLLIAFISTVIVFLVSGKTSQWLQRKQVRKEETTCTNSSSASASSLER